MISTLSGSVGTFPHSNESMFGTRSDLTSLTATLTGAPSVLAPSSLLNGREHSTWSLASEGKESLGHCSGYSSSPSNHVNDAWKNRPTIEQFKTYGASEEALSKLLSSLETRVKEAYSTPNINVMGKDDMRIVNFELNPKYEHIKLPRLGPYIPGYGIKVEGIDHLGRSRKKCQRSMSVPTVDREMLKRRYPENVAMAMELYQNMLAIG